MPANAMILAQQVSGRLYLNDGSGDRQGQHHPNYKYGFLGHVRSGVEALQLTLPGQWR
jgi:hypothetical protein